MAFFELEALDFIEIQRGRFLRRRVEALLACAFGIGGHNHCLEDAFLWRGDAHVDFYMTAFTMRIVFFAETGILADGFIFGLFPFNGSPPAPPQPLLFTTLL